MSGASKRANGRASGPVLTSVFFSIFDHSAGIKSLNSLVFFQHCSHLESLSLAENEFGYDGAVAVARLIKCNKRLKRLDISRNNIAWEGLMLIGKALALNSVLEELKVSQQPRSRFMSDTNQGQAW